MEGLDLVWSNLECLLPSFPTHANSDPVGLFFETKIFASPDALLHLDSQRNYRSGEIA